MAFRIPMLVLGFMMVFATPVMAEPCPGFESAMGEIEASLPPEMPPVVLTPPHG